MKLIKLYLFLIYVLVALPTCVSEDHSWMVGKEVRFDDPRGDILNAPLKGVVVNATEDWITVRWLEGGWPFSEWWHNDTMSYDHIRSVLT